jgi:hypothetical protein
LNLLSLTILSFFPVPRSAPHDAAGGTGDKTCPAQNPPAAFGLLSHEKMMTGKKSLTNTSRGKGGDKDSIEVPKPGKSTKII